MYLHLWQARSSEGLEPLQRLQQQLQQCLQLSSLLHGQLASTGGVAQQAIKLEMQVGQWTAAASWEHCCSYRWRVQFCLLAIPLLAENHCNGLAICQQYHTLRHSQTACCQHYGSAAEQLLAVLAFVHAGVDHPGQDGGVWCRVCTGSAVCPQGHTGCPPGCHQGARHSAGRARYQPEQQQPVGQGAV